MDVFVILLIIIILAKSSYEVCGQYKEYMSKENCMQLRGVCALIILLHHLSQQIPQGGVLWDRLPLFGGMPVSIFFFLSGYGLMKKRCDNVQQCLKYYWQFRIQSIVVPYVIAFVIYFIIGMAKGEIHNFILIQMLIGQEAIVKYSWFVITILVIYLIYYIACVIVKENIYIFIFLNIIGLAIYSAICEMLEFPIWWYISSYAFVSGLVFKYKEEDILKKIEKRIMIYIFGLFVCFVQFFLIAILTTTYPAISIIAFVIAYGLFPVLIILVQRKVHIGNNILRWSGNYAYELYLIQGLPIQYLKKYCLDRNKYFYVMGVIMFSGIGAWLIKKINNRIFVRGYRRNCK